MSLRLVLARIIEAVSKLDSLRVLEEAGVMTALFRTVTRRLPAYAKHDCGRQELSGPAPRTHGSARPASSLSTSAR